MTTSDFIGGAERPRTVRDLQARFRSYDYKSEEMIPKGNQAKALLRLLDVYEEAGLLPCGQPAALCHVCRHKQACWSAAKADARRRPRQRDREDDENGCVPLPWVGPHYARGGVLVLGINPNIAGRDYTDLLIEHSNTWNQYIESFRHGKRAVGRSRFGFAAMRSAAALVDTLHGRPPRLREPKELVETLLCTARLQAVKCMPRVPNSKPYREMWEHCPSLLLGEELNVLRPGILLALGDDPRSAVERLSGFEPLRARALGSPVGRMRGRGWVADVYTLPHPRAGKVEVEESFVRSLRTRIASG